MLTEQDFYDQLKQIQAVEFRQRDLCAGILERLEDEELREFFTRLMNVENGHGQALEDLAKLYADAGIDPGDNEKEE